MDEICTMHLGEMETKSMLKTLKGRKHRGTEGTLKWMSTQGCGMDTTGSMLCMLPVHLYLNES